MILNHYKEKGINIKLFSISFSLQIFNSSRSTKPSKRHFTNHPINSQVTSRCRVCFLLVFSSHVITCLLFIGGKLSFGAFTFGNRFIRDLSFASFGSVVLTLLNNGKFVRKIIINNAILLKNIRSK